MADNKEAAASNEVGGSNTITIYQSYLFVQPKKITIQVKTPKEKQPVEIEENASIKKVF